MSTKHTPGPWITNIERTEGYVIEAEIVGKVLVNSDKLYPLARTFSVRNGTQDANATLIAAAPEMLEALELALAAENQDYSTPDDAALSGSPIHWTGLAKKAIAKARGET